MKKYITSLLIAFSSIVGMAQAPITTICLATVDTTSSYNIIVWERADQISVVGIDSMFIYRRALGGIDSLIGKVHYDSLSEFKDFDANPNLKGYTYRIAGKNVNGVLGPLSTPVRTIHFILVENANNELWLKWTPYIGGAFNYYNCWEMVQGLPDNLVNATSNNVDTAWSFSSAQPQTTYTMKVDVDWAGGCTSTKANHNTTRSNKTTIAFGGPAAVNEHSISEIAVAPNPVNDNAQLIFSSLVWTPITIKVYDMFGRIVVSLEPVKVLGQYTVDLPMEHLSKGMYNVVIDNGMTKTLRIIKN